ncbi:MAG: universal stress protein [Chloroflexota bacterium]|nr:universal stress protein [Chloroflexota bacterium]
MFKKIVVPLDGSELAEGVLPHLAEVIRNRESRVYLLSVSPLSRRTTPSAVGIQPASATMPDDLPSVMRELMEYLRAVAERLEPVASDVWIGVRFGRPADAILAFADEVGADLIATSTHGRSGISRWVFGSVADRLLRGASCPVLLVRAGRDEVTLSPPPTSYQGILVPLDGSELAEQVLPYVKALIRPNRTRIFLSSVLTTGLGDRTVTLLTSYPPGMQLATTALHHAEVQMRAYLRSVANVLRDRGAMVHIAIRQGSPAGEILTYAAEVDADLICMTTHGLSGTSRWVYGNVAGKVLQGARGPVLLVRPAPEQRRER